ncbi:MAG TPA: hypothetical protein PKJ26_04310 [Candidatus Woesebacteria bacterium]|nr:hypothetical protein [Candidatus Woesebacteria bacterium]
MKTEIKNLPLPTAHKMLVSELVNRGGSIELLPDTEVVILTYKDKKHFFIDSWLPLIPYNIGLILTNPDYSLSVLKKQSIQTTSLTGNKKIYYDKNDWLQIADCNSSNLIWKNAPHQDFQQLRSLAKKVLLSFYPSPLITFEVLTDELDISTTTLPAVSSVSWQIDPFIPGFALKNDSSLPLVKVVANLFDVITYN